MRPSEQPSALVTDHDPTPLSHQFEAKASDEFRREFRQKDPGECSVLIGTADAPTVPIA